MKERVGRVRVSVLNCFPQVVASSASSLSIASDETRRLCGGEGLKEKGLALKTVAGAIPGPPHGTHSC